MAPPARREKSLGKDYSKSLATSRRIAEIVQKQKQCSRNMYLAFYGSFVGWIISCPLWICVGKNNLDFDCRLSAGVLFYLGETRCC